MIKYILLFTLLSFVSFAKDITVITNGTVTGTNGQQIKIIADAFEKSNFKVTTKITNQNCALAKLIWDSNKEKTIILVGGGVDGLSDKNNSVCYLEPKKENIVYWLYTSPYYFCSTGQKKWEDLLVPNTRHTVIIHPENKSAEVFNFLSKKYNNNIKTIKVISSSDSITLSKSGEIDFVFRAGIFDLEIFTNRCEWSTFESNGLPGLPSILSDLKLTKNLSTNGYILYKNFNLEEMEELVALLKNAANSPEMLKINQKRNYRLDLVSFNNIEEYKLKLEELYLNITHD